MFRAKCIFSNFVIFLRLYSVYLEFYGAGNLKGLPKCVVHLLDVCKLILPYLISGFWDVFAYEI